MAALSIFIKDPSIDWIKDSDRTKNKDLGNERIQTVQDKLDCKDPTEIIATLLQKNYRIKEIILRLQNLVKTDHRLTKEDLHPEGVARCLINLSSDGAILSRAFHGWRSYL